MEIEEFGPKWYEALDRAYGRIRRLFLRKGVTVGPTLGEYRSAADLMGIVVNRSTLVLIDITGPWWSAEDDTAEIKSIAALARSNTHLKDAIAVATSFAKLHGLTRINWGGFYPGQYSDEELAAVGLKRHYDAYTKEL